MIRAIAHVWSDYRAAQQAKRYAEERAFAREVTFVLHDPTLDPSARMSRLRDLAWDGVPQQHTGA